MSPYTEEEDVQPSPRLFIAAYLPVYGAIDLNLYDTAVSFSNTKVVTHFISVVFLSVLDFTEAVDTVSTRFHGTLIEVVSTWFYELTFPIGESWVVE